MTRKAKAVVCRELNKPVVVEEITVEAPKRGEVLVKIAACGVCHSDLSATNGTTSANLAFCSSQAMNELGRAEAASLAA